ncbi:MAG: phosphodiester glycosidase family protein [Deltaproteobacteria bacterium]|nr:phosphodiester glycosidase family protein [Deltaproteobacteria bacterium]
MQPRSAASLALAFGLVLAAPLRAEDKWSTPFDGVKKLLRTEAGPNRVSHAAIVDLASPGIRFEATTTKQRKRTTSSYGKLIGAQLAVNGDFFSYETYGTSGLSAGAGVAWSDTKDNTTSGTLAFDTGTKLELRPVKDLVDFDPAWMHGVVSGKPWVVTGSVVNSFGAGSSLCSNRHPRTAVGLSEDRKTLVVVVIDGRTKASVGSTCAELGAFLKELGSYDAMNLDGGGSSAMYLEGKGVVNKPSDGTERVVANHLGIFAPKLGTVGSFVGVVHEKSSPDTLLAGAKVSLAKGGETTTDVLGAYELKALPGSYTLTVESPGYQTASLKADMTAGQKVTLDIELVPVGGLDGDQDGIADEEDNCPTVASPDQTDTDGDNVGDVCDADDDGDGVGDKIDPCPLDADDGCLETASTSTSSATSTSAGGGSPPLDGLGGDTTSDASCAMGVARREGRGTLALVAMGLVGAARRLRRRAAPSTRPRA